MLTHLDLCSGCGGFSFGFEATGEIKTIAFAEIDPYASRLLSDRWNGIPNYGDIGNVPAVSANIVSAGLPCQPFSVAGHQRGAGDDRHIWPAVLSVIERCAAIGFANWIVLENVPGIVSMELANIIADLEARNFRVAPPFIVPACAIGARHIRDRVWLVANSAGKPLAKSKMVFPARSILQSGKSSIGLSEYLWRPNRETYLAEMAGDVHGVSDWVDRSKILGNSIVPQIAEIIGQTILAVERQLSA